MLDSNTTVEQQQEQPQVKMHPYTPNQEKNLICDSNDKECLSRLVAAFGDCA